MSLRNCHLVIGAVGLLLFLLTGQYMARVVEVPDLPDVDRMLYRAGHIYLLLACTANVFTGYALPPGERAGWVQRLSSSILIITTFVLAWSFFVEPPVGELDRPVTRTALIVLFAAPAILVLDSAISRFRRRA